jgi:hypothetical protein
LEAIKTKSKKGGEYFIIRNFIICTHHLRVHQFKEVGDRMWELSYTGKTVCMQSFSLETGGKKEETTLAA